MIKVELTSLGYEAYVEEYTLSKTVDDFGVVTKIDSDVKFQNPANNELLEMTARGLTEEPAELTLTCGEDTITYDAFIGHNEGSYNLKNCYATKPIKFKPVYDCVKNKDINIFDYTPAPISTVQGELQRDIRGSQKHIFLGDESQPYTLDQIITALGGIPDRRFAGWAIEHISVNAVPEVITLQDEFGTYYQRYIGHDCQMVISYVRAFSNTQLDSNWIFLSPGAYFLNTNLFTPYTWNVPVFNSFAIYSGFGIVTYYVQSSWSAGRYQLYKDVSISNTYSLNEIIEDIFTCSGKTLVSNFFGINPDGTEPNNAAYDYVNEHLQGLRIVQSYDIIRENALEDSFGNSGIISAKKMIVDLNKLFNLRLIYDSINDVIRWEHFTYLNEKGIDLVANTIQYEISENLEVNKDIVNTETWFMGAETPTDGYYSTQIDYQNYQLNTDINDVPTKIDNFLTDVIGTLNNEDYNQDQYKKLFYLIATDGSSIIGLNKALQLRNLVKELHSTNRPLSVGVHDGQSVNYEGFSIGLSGEVKFFKSIKVFNKLNPGNTVKIDNGVFLIEELEYEKETVTLKIKK